ncbi:hypothetical protein [Paraburkholderia hayleyella]|uniref:hypothetical protein n=1 Tax=Paraburkholderia hayleyella TaxID=2152889 RepID=UPI00129125AF|nr:hypothetical protein [Paraburkholderia hayleyella]
MTTAIPDPSQTPGTETETEAATVLHEPRLWRDGGWTAYVMKNEDDDGWAVAMVRDGEPEPALVGPWTMGRDKKNPKPLDTSAFNTLVKTASEVRRRHEQQLHALLHKRVRVNTETLGEIVVTLQIVPNDDDPYALLSAIDALDETLAQIRVTPGFKLNQASAAAWIENDFARMD